MIVAGARFLLLAGFASVGATTLQQKSSGEVVPNVVAVHLHPTVSCKATMGEALKAAGCNVMFRTDVQTSLASTCSFEVMNSCDHSRAIAEVGGQSFAVRTAATMAMGSAEPSIQGPTTPLPDDIHNITGVLDARYKLGLTGTGIKVAILDEGVYYLHPALGGGFGPGFKVAFGTDLVGDNFDGTSSSIVPDNDPLDDCSASVQGTIDAGIVAGNATFDVSPPAGYVSAFPFTGVAPGVTLGAFRVFGCFGGTTSDIVAQAIFLAADAGADIITFSGAAPGYSDDVDSVAAQIVGKAGHIFVSAYGRSGFAGRNSGAFVDLKPGNSLGGLGIAAFDSVIAKPTIAKALYVDGTAHQYILGENNKNFDFNVPLSLSIVVNTPNAVANNVTDDGCEKINANAKGKAVLLYWGEPFGCQSAQRCNKAAAAGAAACIMYYASDRLDNFIFGLQGGSIPSLLTTFSAGQAILADLAANKTPVVVPRYGYTLSESSTVGSWSSLSSPGLTNDLFIKPDLGGIGANVYSTVSPSYAGANSRPAYYGFFGGTEASMSYVAGCIALLLQKRGKIGFETTRAYLQNTATVTNIYNTSLVHSPAYQGAGLVNIYKAAKTGTLVTPSSLSLNDTAHRKPLEIIRIKNNYGVSITYKLSHVPAATVNAFNKGDDFVLDQSTTTFTPNTVAKVKFLDSRNSLVTIQPGKSATIRIQIFAPKPSSAHPWPLYGGYISITNSFDGIATNIPYAGVAGVWQDRNIWSRNSTSLYTRWGLAGSTGPAAVFGVTPASVGTGLYANTTFTPLSNFEVVNATNSAWVLLPAASSTRSLNITITYLGNNFKALQAIGLNPTNYVSLFDYTTSTSYVTWTQPSFRDTYSSDAILSAPHIFRFDGIATNPVTYTSAKLPAGMYQMTFSAWKNFGSGSEVDVITTPPFQLVYAPPVSPTVPPTEAPVPVAPVPVTLQPTFQPVPKRRLRETDATVLGEDEWQDYKEKCSLLSFTLSLFVDSHLFLIVTPNDGDAVAAAAGCDSLIFHANLYANKKEVAMIKEGSIESEKKNAILLHSSRFSEMAAAFDELSDHVGEKGDIVQNNCGDFVVRFCALLGVKVTPRTTKLIAQRLVRAGVTARDIRNSASFSSIVVRNNDVTDEELVEQLVESRTRALYYGKW